MADFAQEFKSFADAVSGAAKGTLSKIDQWMFRALIDNLKQSDFDVVKESVDQLVKEQKPLAIPPLYFVSKEHPNPYVREMARKALDQFKEKNEIHAIAEGKSSNDATRALIEKYGNYKG